MLIFELSLATLLIAGSYSYTITKDVTPTFPTAEIIHNELFKLLPSGEEIFILCPEDTFLNKGTLTCDFVKSKMNVSSKTYLRDDCRKYELCDGKRCTEMRCPPPLLFNKLLGVCDYPNMASCCEFDAFNNKIILQNT